MSQNTNTSTTALQFDIRGYGPFHGFSIGINPQEVVALVGGPGSGKTMFTRGIKMFRAFMDQGPAVAFDTTLLGNSRNGYGNIDPRERKVVLNAATHDGKMSFVFRYFSTQFGIEYNVLDESGKIFKQEYVRSTEGKNEIYLSRVGDGTQYTAFSRPCTMDSDPERGHKSALRDYTSTRFRDTEDGIVAPANFLRRVTVVQGIDLDQLRVGSQAKQNWHFHMTGQNAWAFLSKWASERSLRDRKTWVIDSLKSLFPFLDDIEFPTRGELVIAEFYHRGMKEKVLARFESDTVIRVAALLTAVAAAEEGSLLVIDNIDEGVDIELMPRLIDLIVAKVHENQSHMIFTTRNRALAEQSKVRVVLLGDSSNKSKPAGKKKSPEAAPAETA